MASPFSIFRKNQRLWMAGAVLIAILSFVVAPMLQSFSGYGGSAGRNRDAKAIAASWAGGSITREQLDTELTQLAIANTFLRKLAVDVRDKGGFPQVPEVRPDFSVVGISQDTRDPSIIVQRKLLVAEANRLGIHFDDQSVKRFLQKFVDGKLSGDQIQKALREVSGGRMNLMDFNRLMREELTKNALLRVANVSERFEERVNSQGLPTTVLAPPSKNWQYFQRFNKTASIEAFPVFVKDFETQVTAKPSDRELRALFEKGKTLTRIDVPIQTEPAFMTPQMADFEFIACDVDKIINEEMLKIPEDVLRSEYERRVKENQYRVPDTTPPAETPAAPETPATTDAPAESTESKPAAEPPASLPPTLENPAEVPAASEAPADGVKPQAFLPNNPNSSVKLVSYQDPAAEPQTPPATDPAPATAATTTTTAADTPTLTIQDSAPQDSAPADAGGALPPTTPATESMPMRTQTFEEVREAIARESAAGQAFKVLEQRISEIRDQMEIYSVNRRAYERAVAEKDSSVAEPEKPNLQEIADKFGFDFGQTGLVDIRTASTFAIGRSRVARGIRMQPFEFIQLIGVEPDPYDSENIGNLYVPLISSSMLTRFLFWKVDQTSASTPSYESAKEAVQTVWQTQRAAELAEAKAKELASRVGASSLSESLDSESDRALVVRPTPFTWLNAMFANFDIQLSNVDGLKPIGNDFMDKVFATAPGQTTIVADLAKEVYYVIKVNGFAPSEEDLLARFSTAPNTTGVQNAANLESARTLPAWFSNVQKQLGFQQK
jgi:hypothetical protein